jgi:hypothetical protein
MVRKIALSVALLFLSLAVLSCRQSLMGPVSFQTLTVEETACEQAWLHLRLQQVVFPAQFTVFQNDKAVGSITVTTPDTMLILNNLNPGTGYKYQLVMHYRHLEYPTNTVSFNTLNPTSHYINWDVTYIGGNYGTCMLYNCAIIDENDIWAVGDIYTKDSDTYDSLGNWINPHNAVHWNGASWELKTILYPGGRFYYYEPIISFCVFNKNSIWFENEYYDGTKFSFFPITEGMFTSDENMMWGSTKDNLYIACNDGSIIRYVGNGQWKWLYTGVHVPINDVYGLYNEVTGDLKVYMALSDFWTPSAPHKIMTLDAHDKVDSVKWGLGRDLTGIWTNKGNIFFTSGDGVFNNLTGSWKEVSELPRYYTNGVRGNGVNDVFVCGDLGYLAHFNGQDWHYYTELSQLAESWFAVAVKGDCIVLIGLKGEQAVIARGTRINTGGSVAVKRR